MNYRVIFFDIVPRELWPYPQDRIKLIKLLPIFLPVQKDRNSKDVRK